MGSSSRSRGGPTPGGNDPQFTRRDVLALAALGAIVGIPGTATAAGPAGQLVYGVHISLAPTWFDPAETPSLVTPYMIYYALHDAMLKPMPGEPMAHSLAESWSATEDGMNYSFVLRDGVTFHNGEQRDRRRREVLLRTLSRCGEGHAARSGRLGGHRR